MSVSYSIVDNIINHHTHKNIEWRLLSNRITWIIYPMIYHNLRLFVLNFHMLVLSNYVLHVSILHMHCLDSSLFAGPGKYRYWSKLHHCIYNASSLVTAWSGPSTDCDYCPKLTKLDYITPLSCESIMHPLWSHLFVCNFIKTYLNTCEICWNSAIGRRNMTHTHENTLRTSSDWRVTASSVEKGSV